LTGVVGARRCDTSAAERREEPTCTGDAEPAERPAGEVLLARIRLRARDMAAMEAELRGWVDEARNTFGVEWPRIAAELGTPPGEARQRFG
jgi:hypothetical protein